MGKEFCAFCDLPQIKERTIVENSVAWAFPTNIPIVPGHVLIAPFRHVANLESLTDEELRALMELRGTLRTALMKAFQAEGFNYAWNEGRIAGQSVPHFHLHMLPRRKGDQGITKYEPRKFLYRPGSRKESSEEELREVAALIKSNLK